MRRGNSCHRRSPQPDYLPCKNLSCSWRGIAWCGFLLRSSVLYHPSPLLSRRHTSNAYCGPPVPSSRTWRCVLGASRYSASPVPAVRWICRPARFVGGQVVPTPAAVRVRPGKVNQQADVPDGRRRVVNAIRSGTSGRIRWRYGLTSRWYEADPPRRWRVRTARSLRS